MLVTPSVALADAVDAALVRFSYADLPTAPTARAALDNSFVVACRRISNKVIKVADSLAPEHLEVVTRDAISVGRSVCTQYGALFIGSGAAEVLGDYGVGPNHTLPTGGTARSFGGLSVHTFLRARTWIEIRGSEGVDLTPIS